MFSFKSVSRRAVGYGVTLTFKRRSTVQKIGTRWLARAEPSLKGVVDLAIEVTDGRGSPEPVVMA